MIDDEKKKKADEERLFKAIGPTDKELEKGEEIEGWLKEDSKSADLSSFRHKQNVKDTKSLLEEVDEIDEGDKGHEHRDGEQGHRGCPASGAARSADAMVEIGLRQAEELRGDGSGSSSVILPEEGFDDTSDGFLFESLSVRAAAKFHKIRVTPLAEVIQAHISHIVDVVNSSEIAVLRKIRIYGYDFVYLPGSHSVGI